MGAMILVGEEGTAACSAIAGIAVGYDDEGALRSEHAGLDRLERPARARLAAELRVYVALLERGSQVDKYTVH